ncbi:MAG: substrate-binding domain-containing protein [Proteobacteria bacterium]|nr:substrate-binding domain-containing protein [Pseudomonadota bacterium]
MTHRLLAAALALACVSFAQAKDITIAHVYTRTGPLEQYGVETQRGLMLGLQYATGGSMQVNGNAIKVIEKDDQGKPDVARGLLAQAYIDDKADLAVGPTSSAVSIALAPVAEENKKILINESAVADSITGEKWNRYIFRTARNSTQDAITNAIVLDKPDVTIATLAQDYAFGRDGIKAFKDNLKHAKIVHEEYVPAATTDFTAAAQHLLNALKDKPGRKIVFVYWAGASNPFKVADAIPKSTGIEYATGGATLPALYGLKNYAGMEGSTYYYYGIPKNPANTWLTAEYYKRFKTPPDFFTVCGMAAGMAIVEALKKTGGDASTEKMIAALEGLHFDTPKGKMILRKEDHQALQAMYHYKLKNDPAFAWAVPELVREIKIEEVAVPIRNKR